MTALINMPRAAWKRQPLIAVKPSVIAQQLGAVFLINFSTYPMDCVANYTLTALGNGYVPGSDANGVGLSSIVGTLQGFRTKNNPVELQFQKLTIFSIFRSTGGDGDSYLLARSMGSSPALSYGIGVWRGFSVDGYLVSVNGSGSSMKDKILTENDAFFDDSKHHVIVAAIGDDKVNVTTNRKVYSTLTDYSGTIDYSRTDLPLYVNNTYAFSGILYACGIFNRVLTQAEALFVCNNPWQLFSPNPRRFYLLPPAGGSSVNLVTDITSASTTPSCAISLSRLLATVLASSSTSPDTNNLNINRLLVFALNSSSITSDAALLLAKALVTSLLSDSSTSNSTILAARALVTALDSLSTTGDTTLAVTALLELISEITSASNTSDVALNVVRNQITAINSTSTAGDVALNIARLLISALSSLSNTGDTELITTALKALITAISSSSSTGDTALNVIRILVSALNSDSSASTSAANVLRLQTTALSSLSSTPDTAVIDILSLIAIATAISSTSSTSDSNLSLIKAFATVLASASSTSSTALLVSRLLETTLGSLSTTSEANLLSGGEFIKAVTTIINSLSSTSDRTRLLTELVAAIESEMKLDFEGRKPELTMIGVFPYMTMH